MAELEDKIERMWGDPVDRRERWLGFLGKLAYEVGGVTVLFGLVFGPVYVVVFFVAGVSPATVFGPSIPIAVLFKWVANKAFCNIIGR